MAIALGGRQHAVSLVLLDSIENDLLFVMPGLVPGIDVFVSLKQKTRG
jgi:hypothetical protein